MRDPDLYTHPIPTQADDREFDVGCPVRVSPLNKNGKIATVGRAPSGRVLYGVVFNTEEKLVKGKKGQIDVYVEARRLTPLESAVKFVEDGAPIERVEGESFDEVSSPIIFKED